ncbi:MAG: toxin ParE1/3/4 [Sphingomonadales bacterium]|jgi:plasmid stabilization system protein ParE|nr:toxin ParE1/3/4 [Sphingomonadales bacterium]
MIPVVISEAADADLVEILECGTENFGLERAEAYVASFQTTFDLLSRHPRAGAVHDEVRPPIRSLPHGSHRVFYDVFEAEVIVQRILHKAVDVKRHL